MKRPIYTLIISLLLLACCRTGIFSQTANKSNDKKLLDEFKTIHDIGIEYLEDKARETVDKIQQNFNYEKFSPLANTALFDSDENLIALILLDQGKRLKNLNLKMFNKLEILVLYRCKIATIDSATQLPASLKFLDLSENNQIHVELNRLKKLEKLNMASCGLTILQSPQLPGSLIYLDLKMNELAFIPTPKTKKDAAKSSNLSGLAHLVQLNLSKCDITTLDSSLLPKKLESLDLESINSLTSVNLTELDTLKAINLKSCQLKNLAFLQLPESIENIDLGSNAFLSEVDFSLLPKLSTLNLSGCDIQILDSSQLPDSLTFLDLGFNNNLRSLDLKDLHKKSIPKYKWIKINLTGCALKSLQTIQLPDSLNELILTSNNSLGKGTTAQLLNLGYLFRLKKLDLSRCGIEKSQLENLVFPYSLKVLNLSYNNSLGIDILKDLGKLEELNLANCGIQKLCLKNLPVLTHLDLTQNETLDVIDLRDENLLQKIELSPKNKIIHLGPGQGESTLQNIEIVFIKGALPGKNDKTLKAIKIREKAGDYRDCNLEGELNGEYAAVEFSYDDLGRPSLTGRKAKELTESSITYILTKWWPVTVTVFYFLLGLLFIYLYPYSPKLQTLLVLADWKRILAYSVKLSIIFAWPLRRRLLIPFRDQLLTFNSDYYKNSKEEDFARCTVTEITSNEKLAPKPILEEIEKIDGPIVLREKPGPGKASFVYYLAHKLYDENMIDKKAPFPLHLKAGYCKQGVLNTIAGRLAHTLTRNKLEIWALMKNKTLTVLIDELDSTTEAIAGEIEKFILDYPQGNILVSTQLVDWEPPKAKIYEIKSH